MSVRIVFEECQAAPHSGACNAGEMISGEGKNEADDGLPGLSVGAPAPVVRGERSGVHEESRK